MSMNVAVFGRMKVGVTEAGIVLVGRGEAVIIGVGISIVGVE